MEVRSSETRARGAASMTRADLEVREAAEDRQALLVEDWKSFAARRGHTEGDVRVKRPGETWDVFCARKAEQATFLPHHEALAEQHLRAAEQTKAAAAHHSEQVVHKFMSIEAARKSALTQARHFLFVDFCDYQRFLFEQQRVQLEGEERLLRETMVFAEDEQVGVLVSVWHSATRLMEAAECERLENIAAEERRRQTEYEQQLQRERELEAQRIADEKAAAEAERERAELEKRLERKRRDEERRAKARAEREQKKAQE